MTYSLNDTELERLVLNEINPYSTINYAAERANNVSSLYKTTVDFSDTTSKQLRFIMKSQHIKKQRIELILQAAYEAHTDSTGRNDLYYATVKIVSRFGRPLFYKLTVRYWDPKDPAIP